MHLYQEGPRDARVVLVGESPGAREVATGRPFVGPSGHLLDGVLERVGLRRQSCFLTNVCHVRPPGDDFDWFLKDPIGRVHYQRGCEQLASDIRAIKPDIVVALGMHVLRTLLNNPMITIGDYRGSVLRASADYDHTRVIGTYHPSFCLRGQFSARYIIEHDIARAVSLVGTTGSPYPKRVIYTPDGVWRREGWDWVWDPNASELTDYDWLYWSEHLAVDVEVVGDHLACIGFSDNPSVAYVFESGDFLRSEYALVLASSRGNLVLQNAMYDVHVLRKNGLWVGDAVVWDTMIGHHVLYPESASGTGTWAKGLGFQASWYTLEPYYKSDFRTALNNDDWPMVWRYNGLDAAVTLEIARQQMADVESDNLLGVVELELELQRALYDAMVRGIKLDVGKLEELHRKITARVIALTTDFPPGLNLRSPKQVAEYLYGELKLPVRKKNGKPTVDEDALVSLSKLHPAPRRLLEIRQLNTLLDRYLEVEWDDDWRARSSFDVTGTKSGRISARATPWGTGINLQTVPESVRHVFVADDNCQMYYADYSQAEARIVAYLAESDAMIALFNDPARDVHTENAARIFHKGVEDVTPEERYLAKRVVHASNYGMGPRKFAMLLAAEGRVVSEREVRRLMDAYFDAYPEIKSVFWRRVEQAIRKNGVLTTPWGRRRVFYGMMGDELLREAYSYIPQSTIADLCNSAVVRVHQIPGVELLLAVHDSILIQSSRPDTDGVIADLTKAMDIPIPIGPPLTSREYVVHIPIEVAVGRNWGKRSTENPDGLQKVATLVAGVSSIHNRK